MKKKEITIGSIKLSGHQALFLLAILLLTGGYRVLTVGSTNDPALKKKVHQALALDLSGRSYKTYQNMKESGDLSNVEDELERFNADNIKIYDISISRPLLSWKSSERVIVKVEYRAPDSNKRQLSYMEFQRSLLFGWQYRFKSTSSRYYMNFL